MSSTTSDLGQAVQPDGTLKDMSEIIWSYDVAELTPFPLDDITGMHLFFSGGCAPAMMVAAKVTTSSSSTPCVPRPLQRARNAAKATAEATTSSSLASTGLGAKRKAPTATVPSHRVVRKVNLDGCLADHSDNGATMEPNTEPASDDYESIKAMADTNNEMCSLPSFSDVVSYPTS
ncbi:hypothetical protein EDB86DRAFT_3078140 [Lactarius hatsudake]|nr:hypothetical protein EDB86DRAFT_3078140 [Lactarius hatsudake]